REARPGLRGGDCHLRERDAAEVCRACVVQAAYFADAETMLLVGIRQRCCQEGGSHVLPHLPCGASRGAPRGACGDGSRYDPWQRKRKTVEGDGDRRVATELEWRAL